MKVDGKSGLLQGVSYSVSPNQDDRPMGEDIEVIVIHAISLPPGVFGGNEVTDLFCNRLDIERHSYFREIKDLKVSAHLFLNRSGELRQFVPLHKRAWHAGVSECLGRAGVNDFSIGIELEGCDTTVFTEKQYSTLTTLTIALIDYYPKLSVDRIFGHSDIATGRKTDPGPNFEWNRYRDRCRDLLKSKN